MIYSKCSGKLNDFTGKLHNFQNTEIKCMSQGIFRCVRKNQKEKEKLYEKGKIDIGGCGNEYDDE